MTPDVLRQEAAQLDAQADTTRAQAERLRAHAAEMEAAARTPPAPAPVRRRIPLAEVCRITGLSRSGVWQRVQKHELPAKGEDGLWDEPDVLAARDAYRRTRRRIESAA